MSSSSSSSSSNRNEVTEIQEEGLHPSPRFDIISDDGSDHQFSNASKAKKHPPKITSSLQKRITHEWRLLADGLPDTILARAYEGRIDLLRAVIVGAAGTPYHDGLFFFDIAFPLNYPVSPPKVHYRSHGYRINPNLYDSGRVCLSLLNTWPGKNSTEKWNSQTSTVLQVLLSLQALVLNERPFFNEPFMHYFSWALIEKMSNAYNEHIFLLLWRTMTHVMSRPPKGFESFIRDHFRDRGPMILAACEAYFGGRVPVGSFHPDEDGTGGSGRKRHSSARLRSGLMQLHPILTKWFELCGADLAGRMKELRADKGNDGGTGIMGRLLRRVNCSSNLGLMRCLDALQFRSLLLLMD